MIGFSGTYYSVRPLFSRHSEGRSSFSLSSLLLLYCAAVGRDGKLLLVRVSAVTYKV